MCAQLDDFERDAACCSEQQAGLLVTVCAVRQVVGLCVVEQ
jgi:hypothetical protein